MSNYIFSLKKTLLRNIGLLIKFVFQIILFVIGLKAITNYTNPFTDQFVVLFLTLVWCFIFLTHFRFNPRLIFVDKKGYVREEY